MLQVENIRKSFGPIEAVRGISFTVSKGEVLGFLGPNGAGKSTTMRMITGFLPPTSGKVTVCGYDVGQQPVMAKKQIGYLPENAPVYSSMTAINFLRFAAELRGFRGKERDARVDKTIETCRLEQVRHQTVGTLSKGYKQRVCFGQAILHDPPLLIMDEPTDGLDPNQKHVVRMMIKQMASEKAIVVSTHILEEVDAVCTRAIIINNGAIAANGSPAELKARSRLHGAVQMTLNKPASRVEPELRALDSVLDVRSDGLEYTVIPENHKPLFGAVMALAKAKSWDVKEVNVLEGRLDEVFRELTAGSAKIR